MRSLLLHLDTRCNEDEPNDPRSLAMRNLRMPESTDFPVTLARWQIMRPWTSNDQNLCRWLSAR